MAMQEVNRQAMLGIVGEALGSQSQEKGREASRLRKERKIAFLETPYILLQAHEYDRTEEGKPPQKLTRPIDVVIGDKTLQVQVVRAFITDESFDLKEETRFTEISGTDPGTGIKYSLFSIEENSKQYPPHREGYAPRIERNTIIRNQLKSVASNQEVLRGLQAITFISDQLANQLLDQLHQLPQRNL